jgi:hypothetical protein
MLADEAFSERAKKDRSINGLAGASRDERSGEGCFAADQAEVKALILPFPRVRGGASGP